MATTTARLTLTSIDLLTDSLSLSASATLTNAGGSTGMTQTTGLARDTISYASSGVIDTTVLYRSDDYTADKANKIYLKNTSSTAAEYFTVYLTGDRSGETHTYADGLIELGRLYAGDWSFFPWNATSGTKEAFTVTFANTWAAGDTFAFDGVTVISAGSGLNEMAAGVDATQFPNWTTTASTAVVTFTARTSRADLEIDTSEAVTTTAASDVYIKPSVHTGMTLEHMLFHEG